MTSPSGRYRVPVALTVEPTSTVLARARWRIMLLAIVFGGFVFGIAVRGMQLCLAPGEQTIQAANAKRWQEVVKRAPRGDILDRHGRRLATSVPTPMVFADPGEIPAEDRAGLAARLAEILDQPRSVIAEKLARKGRYVPLASRIHPAVAWEVEQINHRGLQSETGRATVLPGRATSVSGCWICRRYWKRPRWSGVVSGKIPSRWCDGPASAARQRGIGH